METDILELFAGIGRGDFREPLELLGWLPPGEMAVLDFLPNMPRMLAVRAIAIDRQVQCDLGELQGFSGGEQQTSSNTQHTAEKQSTSSQFEEGQSESLLMLKVSDRLAIRAYRRRAPPLRSLAGRRLSGLWETLDKGLGSGRLPASTRS